MYLNAIKQLIKYFILLLFNLLEVKWKQLVSALFLTSLKFSKVFNGSWTKIQQKEKEHNEHTLNQKQCNTSELPYSTAICCIIPSNIATNFTHLMKQNLARQLTFYVALGAWRCKCKYQLQLTRLPSRKTRRTGKMSTHSDLSSLNPQSVLHVTF